MDGLWGKRFGVSGTTESLTSTVFMGEPYRGCWGRFCRASWCWVRTRVLIHKNAPLLLGEGWIVVS